MSERGPRLGWTLGGLGALLWLPIVAAVLGAHGNTLGLVTAVGFFAAGLAYLLLLPPWRFPRAPMWAFTLGFVVLLLAAAGVVLYAWWRTDQRSMTPVPLLGVFALFVPVFAFGRRSWADIHRPRTAENTDCTDERG